MKLIVLLGATSSGKSDMAVDLAKKLGDSWIFSCDSRQVYKKLNLATGKVEGIWENDKFWYRQVPHFLIDYVEPSHQYTVADFANDFYQKALEAKQNDIKYIILAGGTGLYAKAIVDKLDIGKIKPENVTKYNEYKENLSKLDLLELQSLLQKNNLILNNSDYHNKRRLISQLLRIHSKQQNWLHNCQYYDFEEQFVFAIDMPFEKLKEKIETRQKKRMNQGLLKEVLEMKYLGEERFLVLGLEYRQAWLYLQNKINKQEFEANMLNENIKYAKRQLTWLKKQKLIWIKNLEEILETINTNN